MLIQNFKVRGPRKFVSRYFKRAQGRPSGTKIEEIRLKSAFSLEGKMLIFGPDKPVN